MAETTTPPTPGTPTQPAPGPGEPGQPPAPTPPPSQPAGSGDDDPGRGKGESAAERRIRELNDQKKAAEQKAADFEAQLREKEKAEMSAAERAQAEKKEAEDRATAAEARATSLERGGWARSAANASNFVDPEDAVQMLDFSTLDTEAKVKNAVTKLAESKPHLVRQAGAPAGGVVPPGFGNMGGAGQPDPTVPTDRDGNPDPKFEQGRELLGGLFGRRA